MNLKYHHWALIFLALIMALLPFGSAYAQDNQDETVSYRFEKGDTLLALAGKYFHKQSDYRKVQELNKITDARRIRVGTIIEIPYRLLKFRNDNADVIAFRGIVRIAGMGPAPRAPKLNETISEGVGLATGPDSSLSLSTSDGSVITMPSNSVMRIVKLRRLLLNDILDIEYALDEGGVTTKVQPAKKPADRYRVRTPAAVSAVRGTDFRNRFDPASKQSFAELLEGGLQISSKANDATALEPGFGAAISDKGVKTEALLPSPSVIKGKGKQREDQVSFELEPIDTASAYRLLVARDSAFIDVVAETKGAVPRLTLDNLDNGNYFAKFTAFSQSGLEGLPTQHAFRRRLNSVKASAQQDDDGFTFRWVASGKERKLYRFQLYSQSFGSQQAFSPNSAPPMVDEAALEQSRITLSALPPRR